MEKHEGGCSCGDVRYHITDEPMFTHACHCKLCQRYTASAFVVHSRIEASNFVVDKGKLVTTVGWGHLAVAVVTQYNAARDVAIKYSVTL